MTRFPGMTRIAFFIASLLMMQAFCSAFASESLIKSRIFSDPEVWRLTESLSQSLWGHNIFAYPEGIGVSYVVDIQNEMLYSSAMFIVDANWDRIVYRNDPDDGCLHAYGSWGEDTGPFFRTPRDIEVFSPQSETSIWSYYKIFVADGGNHRIKRLEYNWYTGEFTDLAPIEGIVRPFDIDHHNGGTFDDLSDDRIWVLDEADRLLLYTESGERLVTYGGTGAGIGKFDHPSSVCAGRSHQWGYNPDFQPYANNDLLYVADCGNQRLVRLYTFGDNVTWDRTYEDVGIAPFITDLDVDNFGHVWATIGQGAIAKFTADLVLLDIFGNDASDDGTFFKPRAITNVGGILGVGDMMIAEAWSDSSGLQHYFIGTDISDLAVTLLDYGDHCEAAIFFKLIDYGYLSIKIYDSQRQLVRDLSPGARATSGWKYFFWDGLDEAGVSVENAYYTVEIADTSAYIMIEDWQPANVVVDSLTFYFCDLGFCASGQGASYPPADCNQDAAHDIDDVVCAIAVLFQGGSTWCLPYSVDACMSGQFDIDDVVYLIDYLFGSGEPPPNCSEWVTLNGVPVCE